MRDAYLQVTFRGGRPFAAYYYLPRGAHDASARTERAEPGLVIDFAADDRPIGIEITAPARLTVEAFNRVLARLGFPAVEADELAPLHAA